MTPSAKFEKFYNGFRDIISVVHSSTRLDEVMDLVVWKVTEIIKAKGAILRLLNIETDELELSAAYGIGKNYLQKGPTFSKKVITDICHRNKVIMIDDILTNPRVQYPKEAEAEGIRFIVDVPLSIANNVFGLLRIYFTETRQFSEDELSFIVAIAEQCSCALGKARLIESHELKYHQLALQTEKLSALGRMAAGIAHEINNPLAGILLYSSNLSKKVPADTPLKEGLDIIIDETIRCRKIILELLDFSREREPRKIPTNINDIIEKTLKILENEFKLNRVKLCKDLAEDMPQTMLDGNQIEQVFVNLIINSIQALPEGGVVTVASRVNPDKKMVTVEISDNGHGIEKEALDKIFEPFFSTKAKGTGLGLSVSYGIIHKHQGHIHVDSELGSGTKFLIEIPQVTNGQSEEAFDDTNENLSC
ncbi:MAG: ATP-binding protein [Desulfocapsaceae bacterium]|jgi:signal transduction histidine kinase|nr:ATP-binding protein [Desulfocapsaceae bacterium]